LCDGINKIEELEHVDNATCAKLLADFSRYYVVEDAKVLPNINGGTGLYANENGIYVVGNQAYFENRKILATTDISTMQSLIVFSLSGKISSDISVGYWQEEKQTRAAANTAPTTWSLISTCGNGGAQKLRTDGKVGFQYVGVDNINGTNADMIQIRAFVEACNFKRVRNFGSWFGWSAINFEELRYNVQITEDYTGQFNSPYLFPPAPYAVGTTPAGAGYSSGNVAINYVATSVIFTGGLSPNPSAMNVQQLVAAVYCTNASSQTINGTGSSKFNMYTPSQYGWGGNTFGCSGTVLIYPNF
jgi:hypothetical protein